MRPFKKSCVCEALGVRCVLGAQRHPPGLRVEDQHICGHQVPRVRVSPIPPATGEKQGGQDTARTHTAGKELPGRTSRGSEGGGNSGLRMHLGWRGSAFQNGLRAGGRASFCEKRRRTAAGLLGTEGAHPPVPRVSTLPSAHLPALGRGEPPWAALAPRHRGRRSGAGACQAVDQQPGHLFHNRSQEATTEPVLRSPLPTPLLVT